MSESPVTFGQKAVLRAARVLASSSSLISRVQWEIPDPDQVRDALVSLAHRHDALRTTFHDVAGPEPVQVLSDQVALRSGPVSVEDGQPGWAVRIVGRRLEVTLHRIIADEASVNLFMNELKTIVAGDPLPPCESPRTLAVRQRSPSWRKRRSAAVHYWEHIVDQTAPVLGSPPATGTAVIGFATIPPAGHRLDETASELGLSPGGFVALALARALPAGRDRVIVMVQFANRSEPGLELMLGNQSQAVPVVFHADEVRGSIDTLAETTRWKLVHAQRHGMHDPDVPATLGWDDRRGHHLVTYTEGRAFGPPPPDGIRRGVFSRPHPGLTGGLVVSLKNLDGQLSLGLRGDAAHWTRPTMTDVLDHLIRILAG